MQPVLTVRFYRTSGGTEPVREWLQELSREARRAIGEDIKTVQFGWPLGMPLVRKIEARLWEVRSHVPDGMRPGVLYGGRYAHGVTAWLYQEVAGDTGG